MAFINVDPEKDYIYHKGAITGRVYGRELQNLKIAAFSNRYTLEVNENSNSPLIKSFKDSKGNNTVLTPISSTIKKLPKENQIEYFFRLPLDDDGFIKVGSIKNWKYIVAWNDLNNNDKIDRTKGQEENAVFPIKLHRKKDDGTLYSRIIYSVRLLKVPPVENGNHINDADGNIRVDAHGNMCVVFDRDGNMCVVFDRVVFGAIFSEKDGKTSFYSLAEAKFPNEGKVKDSITLLPKDQYSNFRAFNLDFRDSQN